MCDCEGVTRECMPPHDHERPTLYLGASLAFERTTEHKSFRIPGTPVSSVNTGWEASEISIRDSIRSATKLDNFCGLERQFLLLYVMRRSQALRVSSTGLCIVPA